MQRIPRTHEIAYFLDLNSRGMLDLNPPYQRRSVWTRKDREYFIDTVMNNYPSPAVFIHRTTDDNGRSMHHVVDGKQRLETIIDFTKNKIRIPTTFGDERLRGKKWDDLSTEDRRRFWDYPISVEFLPMVDEAVVNTVFERINRNSRKLTAQELRHAKFDGWFATFAETQAADDDWEQLGLVTKARAKRMGDVQFISELLMLVVRNAIQGFDQDAIDAIYADLDDPDEATLDKTTDEISTDFSSAKQYLRAMCTANAAVKDPIKTLANLYSLWGWIALTADKMPADVMAPKYVHFMEVVSEFQRDATRQVADGATHELELAANRYAANLAGASTDETPRRARHESLSEGLALIP